MLQNDPPFLMLDEAAVAAAQVWHEPYDFAYVAQAFPAKLKPEVLADAPVIPDRGSYPLPWLKYGPRFGAALQDLLNPRFKHLVEKILGMDLTPYPPCIVMMGNTTGHYNEGYSHPDSPHKIVTVLVGFTEEWPYPRGQLRILRSDDRQDYAFEFTPVFGHILMFRVCDHSYHGFLPQKAKRMSLQMCYVDSPWYVRREYWRHSASAFAKSVPLVRTLMDYAPRRGLGAK